MDYTRVGLTTRLPGLVARIDSAVGDAVRLAVGQVVEGVVMEVRGAAATISLPDGRISAETRAPLQPGDQVRLLVKDVSAGQVQLQILSRQAAGGVRAFTDRDLRLLLQSLGLEPTELNQQIVRELAAQGLPLEARTIQELAAALGRLGGKPAPAGQPLPSGAQLAQPAGEQETGATGPDEADVRAAVWLRARGLPLTTESLELARLRLANLPELGRQLAEVVRRAGELKARFPAAREALEAVETGLGELALLETDDLGDLLPETVRAKLDQWGTGLENKVARWLNGQLERGDLAQDARVRLGQLQERLDHHLAQMPLGGEQEKALAGLRHDLALATRSLETEQLLNAQIQQTSRPPAGGEAGGVVVQVPWSAASPGETARIRVLPETEHLTEHGLVRRRRLVFEFDLETLQRVEVDLTVVGGRIACHFASNALETLALVRAHHDDLRAGIERLGYALDDVTALPLAAIAEAPKPQPADPLRRVDTLA